MWIPTDCDYEIVEVASSAELAGDVTVGVTSSADPASVVTAGVALQRPCRDSVEKCRDSVVIPTDCDYEIAEVVSSAELSGDSE